MEYHSGFGEPPLITGLVLTHGTKSALKGLTAQNQGGLGWKRAILAVNVLYRVVQIGDITRFNLSDRQMAKLTNPLLFIFQFF